MGTEIDKNGKLIQMDNKEQIICVTPTESEIIGVDDNYIYIKEIVIEDEDNCFPCVLKIPRHEYMRVFNIWLDFKADYCKRFQHFCGVFGSFDAIDYSQQGQINILLYIDEKSEEPIFQDVPLIEVTRFDDQCDMEHG